jgi:hypothetical protein
MVRRWFPWVDDVRLTPWPPVQAATPLLSLSSDPATVFQVSRKRSKSASVVLFPMLARMAPRASAASTPMAARTSEGWTFPDEQAEPDETAIPLRSKAIMAVSA